MGIKKVRESLSTRKEIKMSDLIWSGVFGLGLGIAMCVAVWFCTDRN